MTTQGPSSKKSETTTNRIHKYISYMANVPSSIVTRNMADFAAQTGNVYMSVAVISKRANQISVKLKEELSSKLAEFATTVDNLEEVFENREQIEISKYYERLPKPTNLAVEEFLEGKVYVRNPSEEETQEEEINL